MELRVNILKTRPELICVHNGEELIFSANAFQKKTFQQEFDVLEPINAYWQRLSDAEQQSIFDVYSDVYRGFDQIVSSHDLHNHLNTQIKLMVELMPLDRITTWVSIDPAFIMPIDLQEIFIPDAENKNSAEKTYLRSDYVDLIAYSVFVRALMPIFGEYINSIRRSLGVEKKEDEALKLLYGTGVLQSKAVLKLADYIKQITKDRAKNAERILSGNSSLDQDDYLLALVTIRKLCVSDVRGAIGEKGGLVSRVYSFIYQKVFNPTKTDVPIREKKFGTDEGDRQNKRSILESYRKRTELSLAEIAGFEHGYHKLLSTALKLAPGITEAEVMACVETARAAKHERIGDAQLIIMACVFKNIHSPNTIYYITPEQGWENLGVLEAVLWHWGFHYLSILVTSHTLISEDMMHVSPIDNRGQISSDIQAEIKKQYPFVWSNNRKSGIGSSDEPHPVLNSIDIVVDDLLNNAWRATASQDKLVAVFDGEARRKMVIPPNIKTMLAQLIVYVSKLEIKQSPVLKMPSINRNI